MHLTAEAVLLAELRSFAEMSKRNAENGFGKFSEGRASAFRDMIAWIERSEAR